MESQKDSPSVILRNRTPRDKTKTQEAVRESLLTDSTSGIVKGDDDTTSIDSFSSPELDISRKESILNFKTEEVYKSVQYEEDFDGIKLDSANNNMKKTNGCLPVTNHAFEAIEVGKVIEDQTHITNDDKKVTIPDGGWGWIVVLSSFVISMIADGISFSFGLLYIEFLDEFQASKSTTAWIGSLFIAVPLLSGPVMSALVDRYGCRSMTILGGIISTIGFVLASISTTLEMMMITFGVIAGLGLGLVYVTAVVSIAYWFEKKRNLAVGLGACGTGVGTFVYAPMTQYFIEEFGWRGTILLLSGTLLNLCVCGCVMRDPEWWILEQKKQRNSKDDDKNDKYSKEDAKSKQSSSVSIANGCYDNETLTRGKNMKRLITKGLSPEQVIKDEVTSIRRCENVGLVTKQSKRLSESLVTIPTYLTYDDKVSKNILDTLVNNASPDNTEIKVPSFKINSLEEKDAENSPPIVKFTNDALQRTHSERFDDSKEKMLENCQLKHPKLDEISKSLAETKENKPLIKQDSKESRKDWFKKQLSVNHHYLKDLKMPLNSISHRNAMLNIKRYKLKASSCPDIFKNSMITVNEQEENWYDDCVSCLADMFNVSLFKKATFNLLCFGTIIIFVWFIVPYFYLAEHMIQEGYTEDDGAFMLSLIGITNTIGMVSLGWIGDFPNISISNLYAVCLILCGASVAAIPQAASSYWILASICAAFGLLFAASFTFTPSLLVTLVSLDDFTTAYGLVLLAQGIGHLIGPPLSGLIFDVTASWELSFYLAGGWIVVAGVLIAFIHPVKKYQQKRAAEAESDSSMA
ncbi:monocarboxylate transporter 14-like [Maniola jurtina]|uniref:monocarboxylate transporter 14-like n=1 Tax=Maniola jurtina TaxID=191418 RepID=UPI001E68B6BA|nr:monocarboxylate transporter 14-like [Maniola jurtina]